MPRCSPPPQGCVVRYPQHMCSAMPRSRSRSAGSLSAGRLGGWGRASKGSERLHSRRAGTIGDPCGAVWRPGSGLSPDLHTAVVHDQNGCPPAPGTRTTVRVPPSPTLQGLSLPPAVLLPRTPVRVYHARCSDHWLPQVPPPAAEPLLMGSAAQGPEPTPAGASDPVSADSLWQDFSFLDSAARREASVCAHARTRVCPSTPARVCVCGVHLEACMHRNVDNGGPLFREIWVVPVWTGGWGGGGGNQGFPTACRP